MAARREQAGARAQFMLLGGSAPIADSHPGENSGSGSAGVSLTIPDATTARIAAVTDNNNIIEFTNTAAVTYTIKPYAEVPLPVGAILMAQQGNTGQVTFVPNAGVTFETSDSYKTRARESFIAMKHTSLNNWKALGDLEVTMLGLTVMGRAVGLAGPPSALTATAERQALMRRSGVLGFFVPRASETDSTPSGGIASSNVQDAINELDALKADKASVFAVAGGTADVITATLTIAPILVDGLAFRIRASAANLTTTPTFNPNTLGALPITKYGGLPLLTGDIRAAGHEMILLYRAAPARYELLNPALPTTTRSRSIYATFDGGGSVIAVGATCFVTVPFSGVLVSNTLLGDVSGSVEISVWKGALAAYPLGSGNSIVASAAPAISGGRKSQDLVLNGWTKTVTAGDVFQFTISSVDLMKKVTLILEVLS